MRGQVIAESNAFHRHQPPLPITQSVHQPRPLPYSTVTCYRTNWG